MIDDGDREAILRRRAMFLTAALSTFACSSPSSVVTEPTASAPPPQTSASASASAAEPNVPPDVAARQSFAEYVKAEGPPFTVSKALSAEEQTQLEAQARKWAPVYERLERVWNDVPLCSLASVECRPAWERTLRSLSDLEAYDVEPKCGYSHSDTAGYVGREEAHRRFLQRTIEAMRAELATRAVDEGAETIFDAIYRPRAFAGACLSCLPSVRVDERIIFDAVSSTLSPLAEQQLAVLAAMMNRLPGLILHVRGHADSSEPNAEALGTARAKAVFDWLVKNGAPAKRLRMKSIGAELPLGSSVKPEGRVNNRRVDFEAKS